MKILQIASGDFFSTFGGGQVYVKNLVDGLIDLGADVEVVSLIKGGDSIREKNYRDKRIIEIGRPDDLAEVLKLMHPDIIHVHSLKAIACRYGKEHGIPVVVTAHHGGILCPAGNRLLPNDDICLDKFSHEKCLPCVLRNIRTGSKWYPMMRQLSSNTYIKIGELLRKLPFIPFVSPIGEAAVAIQDKMSEWSEIAEGCTKMISPSVDLANAMVINGLSKEKITILPHGIPTPSFGVGHKYDGTLRLFYVGRICYDKGIHTLLEAFLLSKVQNKELHLIGSTSNKHEQRYLNNLRKKYDDSKRIIWHGKITPTKIYDKIAEFDVAVSASLLESFGLNIAEALAMKKPVIASRCGGSEMQIQDGVNGWLVERNNAQQIAERIDLIANSPTILDVMSRNCHAISIEDHCQSLLKIYEETRAH